MSKNRGATQRPCTSSRWGTEGHDHCASFPGLSEGKRKCRKQGREEGRGMNPNLDDNVFQMGPGALSPNSQGRFVSRSCQEQEKQRKNEQEKHIRSPPQVQPGCSPGSSQDHCSTHLLLMEKASDDFQPVTVCRRLPPLI